MFAICVYDNNDSLNFYMDQICKQLKKKNIASYSWNSIKENVKDMLVNIHSFLENDDVFLITYDCRGVLRETPEDDDNIFQKYSIKILNIFVDHPLSFHSYLECKGENAWDFFPDYNHIEYVKKYFPHREHLSFLPHAGTSTENIVPYNDRKYDIVFSATYWPAEDKMRQINKLTQEDANIRNFFIEIMQILVDHNELTIEQAFEEALKARSLTIPIKNQLILLQNMKLIDEFIRMFYREKVVKAVADSGASLILVGEGWENHPVAKYDNVSTTGRKTFSETLEYMKQARITVNCMPWFKDGTHERIFNAALCKSVVFTDPSSWLKNAFTDDEISFYSLNNLALVPPKFGIF